MSWWYEIIRIFGWTFENKEIERIIQGEASPVERLQCKLALKSMLDHGEPKQSDFRLEAEYMHAKEVYYKIESYYNSLKNANGKA